jgi:hypothetical protein
MRKPIHLYTRSATISKTATISKATTELVQVLRPTHERFGDDVPARLIVSPAAAATWWKKNGKAGGGEGNP